MRPFLQHSGSEGQHEQRGGVVAEMEADRCACETARRHNESSDDPNNEHWEQHRERKMKTGEGEGTDTNRNRLAKAMKRANDDAAKQELLKKRGNSGMGNQKDREGRGEQGISAGSGSGPRRQRYDHVDVEQNDARAQGNRDENQDPWRARTEE